MPNEINEMPSIRYRAYGLLVEVVSGMGDRCALRISWWVSTNWIGNLRSTRSEPIWNHHHEVSAREWIRSSDPGSPYTIRSYARHRSRHEPMLAQHISQVTLINGFRVDVKFDVLFESQTTVERSQVRRKRDPVYYSKSKDTVD